MSKRNSGRRVWRRRDHYYGFSAAGNQCLRLDRCGRLPRTDIDKFLGTKEHQARHRGDGRC